MFVSGVVLVVFAIPAVLVIGILSLYGDELGISDPFSLGITLLSVVYTYIPFLFERTSRVGDDAERFFRLDFVDSVSGLDPRQQLQSFLQRRIEEIEAVTNKIERRADQYGLSHNIVTISPMVVAFLLAFVYGRGYIDEFDVLIVDHNNPVATSSSALEKEYLKTKNERITLEKKCETEPADIKCNSSAPTNYDTNYNCPSSETNCLPDRRSRTEISTNPQLEKRSREFLLALFALVLFGVSLVRLLIEPKLNQRIERSAAEELRNVRSGLLKEHNKIKLNDDNAIPEDSASVRDFMERTDFWLDNIIRRYRNRNVQISNFEQEIVTEHAVRQQ